MKNKKWYFRFNQVIVAMLVTLILSIALIFFKFELAASMVIGLIFTNFFFGFKEIYIDPTYKNSEASLTDFIHNACGTIIAAIILIFVYI